MKLDKKVKENALIGHGFNSEKLKLYIGKECYFADTLEDFINLTNTLKGVLESVSPDAEECYLVESEINGVPAEFSYAFCLPAEFVKEENKYRPFTDTKEFFLMRNREVGDLIHIRSKLNNYEYHLLIIGWTDEGLMLGNFSEMTFDELLDKFELWDAAAREWVPFGVEDKE